MCFFKYNLLNICIYFFRILTFGEELLWQVFVTDFHDIFSTRFTYTFSYILRFFRFRDLWFKKQFWFWGTVTDSRDTLFTHTLPYKHFFIIHRYFWKIWNIWDFSDFCWFFLLWGNMNFVWRIFVTHFCDIFLYA